MLHFFTATYVNTRFDPPKKQHDYHVWFGQNEEGSAWEPDAECLLIMGRNDLITPLLANDSPTGQADVIKQVVQFRKWKQHNFQLWVRRVV